MAYEIIVAKFTPDELDERIDAVLPDGVVGIGAKAFRFKGEVRSLRAPQSLIEVGDAAFDGCRNLVQVDFPGDVARVGKRFPTLHLAARDNVRRNARLHR